MDNLSDRLELIMEESPTKIKKAAIAKACGVKESSVNDWFSGKTKNIVGETLFLAAEFLKVEPRWLASGKGPMRPTTFNHDKRRYAIIEHIMHAPPDKLDKIEDDIIQACEPNTKIGNNDNNK